MSTNIVPYSQTLIPPPFTLVTALRKVRLAEDVWNSRDSKRVLSMCTVDSKWRERSEYFVGHVAIRQFLIDKWNHELDYRLVKDLWTFTDERIAVRIRYEWRDADGQWHRSYGNEQWEFDENGLMRRREASINDVSISESKRQFFWPAPGARPTDHPGIPNIC